LAQRRTDRQAILRKTDPPESVFYIHETALDLKVGTVDTMHDQMKWLAFLCDLPQVSPLVIPAAAGAHTALLRPMTLLAFAKGVAPLAFVDGDVTTVFLENVRDIEVYRRKLAFMVSTALNVDQSREVFEQRADAYGRTPGDASLL
jgi:hypothetical protein